MVVAVVDPVLEESPLEPEEELVEEEEVEDLAAVEKAQVVAVVSKWRVNEENLLITRMIMMMRMKMMYNINRRMTTMTTMN